MGTMRLLIAAAVLAALGGGIWYSNQQEAAKQDQRDPDAPPQILALDEAGLRRIEIHQRVPDPDGTPRIEERVTVLEREEAQPWQILEPAPMPADQGAIASLTSATSSLDSQRIVDEAPTDLAPYGLDPALIAITFTSADGTARTLRVGEETPDGGGVYATVDGNDGGRRLYTMATFAKTAFDKGAQDLREQRLLVFSADEVRRLRLEAAGQPAIVMEQPSPSQWAIVEPQPLRADHFEVSELVSAITGTRMDITADAAEANRAYSSGRRATMVRLTFDGREETLEVRQSGGEFYASSSTMEGAFKISAESGDALNKTLDQLRNHKLFDFGFDDVSNIHVTDGDRTREFDKADDVWVSDARGMDSLSVQNLVDKLRDLAAASFTGNSFGEAEITLTVQSERSLSGGDDKAKDGGSVPSRTETVEIGRSGDTYLARRPGEAGTYVLDEAAISDLRQAVAGVREPPE